MSPSKSEAVVADALRTWDSPLEAVLFGTAEPAAIVRRIDGFCRDRLDEPLDRVLFYRRGVGAVFGVALADDRRAVIKVHRPELIPEGLDGIRTIQRRLAEAGLPAPMPLAAPAALGRGVAAAEELLEHGAVRDAHDSDVRRILATELHRFVTAATPSLGSVVLPSAYPFGRSSDDLWPTPHDLRFDLTLSGGEWIDDLAREAVEVLLREVGEQIIGHLDWRVENLRIDRTLVAIFDWDSVAVCPEPALVGMTSSSFTSEWNDPAIDPYPSVEEMDAFVSDYEEAKGSAFSPDERRYLGAARIFRLAYGARCEHSDAVLLGWPLDPNEGWTFALRAVTS
jgi:hypothetical protein